MADKRISQLIERVDIANNDVLPIVASGATTTNKVTVSTLQDWMQDNLDVGVTSVGLSMPSAFVVSNSPVTASGNISVTGAGTVSQYIRGDGSLADFPSGGGGGGSSVNYYLNGSVSQGTIGGVAYLEMNKTPVLGAGTDFNISADGYIASFITDAGDPALLEIPAGNWNFETYFQASSGGGTPSFYIELYKVSGATATLIASNSGNPELIAFGTNTTPYFSALAVPQTTLALTDRLAIRIYVVVSGRTITLHTENSNLCQIITTFTTGLTALNGLTAQVQNFATGTSGTDFGITSSVSTHTFNLPTASATNRGVLSSADWSSFNGKVPYTGAVANVDLGSYSITANAINSAGSGSTAGQINLRSDAFFSLVNGYGSIASGTTNQFNLYQTTGAGVFRGAILSLNSITASATRTYTLPDADGTLALTSQIPTNPVGGTGAQGRVAYWNGAGTITSDSLFQWNDTFKRLGIGRTPTVSLDVEGAGYFSGALGVGGALNGTSASFTGAVTSTTNEGLIIAPSSGASYINYKIGATSYSLIGVAGATNDFIAGSALGDLNIRATNNQKILFSTNNGSSSALTLASTGAATFSSSVTASNLLVERTASRNMLGISSISLPTSGAEEGVAVVKTNSNLWQMSLVGYAADSKGMRIYNTGGAGNTSLEVATGAGTSFIVNGSGNVGIGTASPSGAAGLALVLNSGANQGRICVKTSSTGDGSGAGLQIGMAGLAAFIEQRENADLTFGTNAVERMRITSAGKVIVGTSNFTYPVSIEAQSGGGQLALTRSGAYTEFYMSGSSESGTQLFIRSGGSGGVYLAAGGTGWISASDEMLKTDLVPIENGLEKVASLRSVIGRYLTDSKDKKRAFLIAQDVIKVLPEAVVTNEETGEMGVSYTEVIPLLVAAIKELKTEIDSLKNQMQ